MVKFLNTWYIVIWAALIGGLFLSGVFEGISCWDGIAWDEGELDALCDVTPAEYEARRRASPDFCPEGVDARELVGGCSTYFSWEFAAFTVLGVSMVYNVLYGGVYFILKRNT